MARQDTMTLTMTMATDVDVNVNNTASCEAVARRKAEAVQIYATLQPAGVTEEGGFEQ